MQKSNDYPTTFNPNMVFRFQTQKKTVKLDANFTIFTQKKQQLLNIRYIPMRIITFRIMFNSCQDKTASFVHQKHC